MKSREFLDLFLVLVITIGFTLFSLSIDLIDMIYNYFYAHSSLPIFKFLVNIIFLWLVGLLWITYRRWKKALKIQRKLENIISSISPYVLLVIDRHRNIIMCNDSVKKMFGYKVDEVISQKTDFLYSDRHLKLSNKHEIYDTVKTVGFHAESAIGKKKDGEEINLEIIAAKLSGREGAVLLLRDISEREKAYESSRKAEERYQNLIENANDAIISTNGQGVIIGFNKRAEEIFDYTREEILGKSVTLLSPEEDREGERKALEQFKTTGTLGIIGRTVEREGLKKDGQRIPLEATLSILESEDDVIITAILRDVSERKKAAREIKEAKEFLENIIENSKDGIIITDETGHILSVNTAMEKMSGLKKGELIGEHPSSFIIEDEEVRKKVVEKMPELFEKGYTYYETIHRHRNGSHINVECSASTIKDDQGNYIAGISIIRDITERKKMERQLFQSEKLKSLGELAGGVAHDFNNVLAAILGRAQLLKMNAEPPPGVEEKRQSILELKKGLEVIENAARDGAETVRRIQEFARRRDDDKYFTTVDVNELIDNAIEFTKMRWKNDAESKGIKFNIVKELSPLPHVKGSATELREVFINLINNALDAMPESGDITLKTHAEGNQVVIVVEDTGCGMPEYIKDRIFDPFYTTKGVQSTGLGLSVSYGIINRHRGTIKVESIEGEGTTFIIKLPISEMRLDTEEKVDVVIKEQRKAHILLIEDEKEVRDTLAAILKNSGHEVELASDGKQGIDIFEKKEVDLVFTDLGMPGMSGWQVAEKVKSINGRVPVVIITGWNIEVSESEMKDKWVDLIIQKPFEVNQVLRLVQEGLILRDRFKAA